MSNSFCNSYPEERRKFLSQIAQTQSNFPSLEGLRVLVVDDNADTLDLVEIIFE